ncbi:MAG: CotH kinase family protein, partial [bacterium]|nr:CotH kinase family protein [bacterium]
MKQLLISYLIILLPIGSIIGQTLTTSNLPIVIIDTQQQDIPDEPKINATMGIIYNGPDQTNNINDSFNHYNGNIGIESRGNSTQDFDKKSYSVELWDEFGEDISLPLLGMGEEEDWILHSMVIDKSHVRIPMTFYFAQKMGHYASNWRYVELVINGEYRGLYILTEKIKRDQNRVDISKLKEDDLSGDQLTGGYILRIDWLDDPEGFESQYNSQGGEPMLFQWYYPRARDIKPEQAEYIENWIGNFEDALFSSTYRNENGERYTDLIDLDSFVDFLLINELSKNSDGYKLSSYIHKDRDSKGGKLVAGPIWDFDQTYGVSEVCSNSDYTGWTYLQNQEDCEDLESMPMWWQRMMNDSHFQNRMRCR